MLPIGSLAPDFEAVLDDKSPFKLSALRGKKNVVLYFYPADFTPGCTAQACSFRDGYGQVRELDGVIYGVSGDAVDSHGRFREQHKLPFQLIADPEKKIHKLYNVGTFLGFLPARITYVIDKTGLVRAAFEHDVFVSRHLPDTLSALKLLHTK